MMVYLLGIKEAGVSESADETDSKSVVPWSVWVQVPPPAPITSRFKRLFFVCPFSLLRNLFKIYYYRGVL